LNPLDPRVTIVWRLTGLILALPATAIAGVVEAVVLAPAGIRLLTPGLITGLAALSLVIYTAGTRGADASIPGLAADDAERLREELARLEELDDRA
jgi:hypothetical protein